MKIFIWLASGPFSVSYILKKKAPCQENKQSKSSSAAEPRDLSLIVIRSRAVTLYLHCRHICCWNVRMFTRSHSDTELPVTVRQQLNYLRGMQLLAAWWNASDNLQHICFLSLVSSAYFKTKSTSSLWIEGGWEISHCTQHRRVERFGDFIGSGRLRDRPVYRREGCVILGDLFKCFQLFMLGWIFFSHNLS